MAYEDSRFAYQIMGGLSAQISQHVEFHFGYRFRSSRGDPIDSDQIESGLRRSGFDANPAPRQFSYSCREPDRCANVPLRTTPVRLESTLR